MQSVPAWAADEAASATARVNRLSDEGAALFKARDYKRALDKFQEAYALDADPNLLYNMARCFESLGETEAAIEKYDAFLAKPGGDTHGRLKAEQAVRALRDIKATAATTRTATPASGPPPAHEAEPSGGTVAPWILLGTAVLAAGAGTALYVLGSNDHNKITSDPNYGTGTGVVPFTQAEAQDLKNAGDTKKVAGAVLLGVGGAAAVTALVVALASGGSKSVPKQGVNAQPIVAGTGVQGGYLSFEGRF